MEDTIIEENKKMNTTEKMLAVEKEGNESKIVVTHVTIRQSISFLVLKLILLEAFAAGAVIAFHSLFLSTTIADVVSNINGTFTVFNVFIFLILVIIKTAFVVFIILQWLNEYYEITPKEVIHKSGLIFRREERHTLNHLGSIELEQNLFGKVFNYGTIKLYNWTIEKYVTLYLIHNPLKYHHILQTLLPDADKGKSVVREHIIEPYKI